MKFIPYASVIGSIKYAMLCTRPIVYPALSLAREYNMFLDYGGDKRFVVKGYVDANFDTDPDDSKSQSGCILKVGAIS